MAVRGSAALRAAAVALVLVSFAVPVIASGEFVYPVSGRLTSTYYSPRPYGIHAALDIAAASWTPIGAARAGQVSFVGWSGGYGNLVIIDHGNGYQTYYAHQVKTAVSRGRRVSQGETIGYVGTTGNSTGPHLHFEVRRSGSKQFLPGSGGNWVTKGRAIPHSYPGLSGGGGGSPPPAPSTGVKVIEVTASDLNVRTGASTGHSVRGQIQRGERYVRIATAGSWEQIWFDGATAWVHGGYTRTLAGAQAEKVTASVLNVRTGPGTTNSIAGSARAGQYYARAGSSGSWAKIWFKSEPRWIHAGYSTTVSP